MLLNDRITGIPVILIECNCTFSHLKPAFSLTCNVVFMKIYIQYLAPTVIDLIDHVIVLFIIFQIIQAKIRFHFYSECTFKFKFRSLVFVYLFPFYCNVGWFVYSDEAQ